MEEQRRTVLERVARGELSPAEGAALLDELESGASGSRVQAPPGDRASMIRVVRLSSTRRRIPSPTR